MTTTNYYIDETNPLTKPTITIDLNNATFLSIVLDKWLNDNHIERTPTMNELLKKLQSGFIHCDEQQSNAHATLNRFTLDDRNK
jgi:hypothetical protein